MSRRGTAYHEAGHAVADVRFGFGSNGVSIVRSGTTLGRAAQLDPPSTAAEYRNQVVSFLAGYAAEVREYPCDRVRARAGASSDFERADQLLEALGEERRGQWLRRAHAFVAREWDAVVAVARELLRTGALDGDEVHLLVEDGPSALASFRSTLTRSRAQKVR